MDNNSLSEAEQNKEVVQAQLAEFASLEDAIHDFLSEITQLKIRDQHSQAREELRNFANSNENAFRFLANIVNETEGYFETVKEVIDDTGWEPPEDSSTENAINELRNLGVEYSALAPAINVVYLEKFQDRLNPITTYDSFPGYSQSMQEPMVNYNARSGEVPILETRNSVGIMMYVAWTMIGATRNSIETTLEQEREINSEEVERIFDALNKLKEEIDDLDEIASTLAEQ